MLPMLGKKYIKMKGKIKLNNFSIKGYWVGILPNILRNSLINAAELATYINFFNFRFD
jgi:hypothetical protein